jgi:hypothetical protein
MLRMRLAIGGVRLEQARLAVASTAVSTLASGATFAPCANRFGQMSATVEYFRGIRGMAGAASTSAAATSNDMRCLCRQIEGPVSHAMYS